MNATLLLNMLTIEGFQLRAEGDELELSGPRQRLTPELRAAIREHKPTLLGLLRPSYEAAERAAIRWADTAAADESLQQALDDWDTLMAPPEPCSCGCAVFRWDIEGNRHCTRCSPGQSERVTALAGQLRADADARTAGDCTSFFDGLLYDMHSGNPAALDDISQVSEADTACRCGSRMAFSQRIHNGESLRRDCAGCGRFREFAVWGAPEAVAGGLLSYNESESPEAVYTPGDSDQSPLDKKGGGYGQFNF